MYRGAAALIGGAIVAVLCAVLAIDLMAVSGTKDLVGAAILMFVAVLAWLFGVYPAAFSWSDRLVVRNPFRTIDLPWHIVVDLNARLSFMAHTETKRFTVWAIPVSLRERRRSERHKMRESSQAQRMARRGLSPDLFGSSTSRRPYDPIASLSFADQAISEMNVKRETYLVMLKAAKAREAQAAGGSAPATEAAAPVVRAEGEEAAPPVFLGTVRWTWVSIVLLAASIAFLVAALIQR